METSKVYATAALIGATAGLRAITPLAAVGVAAQQGSLSLRRSPLTFLYSRSWAIGVGILAAAEIVGDKLPQTPSRLKPFALIPRILAGAACGATVCAAEREDKTRGAMIGALAALGGSFAGYYYRQSVTENNLIPPVLAAVIEDTIAVGGSLSALSSLR